MIILHFIFTFVSVLLAAKIVGVFYSGWKALLIFTILLTIVNGVIRPIINILTWPINLLTLGLFKLFLNVLFLLLISKLTPGFIFASFWQAAIYSVILYLIEWILFKFEIVRL